MIGAPALAAAALCTMLGLARPAAAAEALEADWAAAGTEAAELLSGYLRIDTSNPPGRERAGAEYLLRFFEAEGIPARLLVAEPTRANVVARLPATRPDPQRRGAILLLHHIDVVPADPAAWSFPPFSGAIEDGFVHGRGALDDKGHGAVHALALALLRRSGLPRSRDIVLAGTAAEETGDDDAARVGVEWMLAQHPDALGPPAVVWNEGGASTPNSLVGDRVVNAVASTEKRALWITLVVEGEGGHGSTPGPDGANTILLGALSRIVAWQTPLRVTRTVDEMFDRLAAGSSFPTSLALRHVENPFVLRLAGPRLTGRRVTNALVRDTIALTGMSSFVKHNVIPRRAEAMLDVRLLPDTDAALFLAMLRAVIADPRVRIEGLPEPLPPPSPESPPDHELVRALEAELARELPGSFSVPLQTTGGSDSKFFRARGIPAYGYAPVLLPDELVSSIHGVDERVPVAELERAVRVTARTLLRLMEPAQAPAPERRAR